MASDEHLKILKLGRWNSWRAKNLGMIPDLSAADIRGMHLMGADLTRVNLSGANLSGVDLSVADLSDSDLSGADLSNADLKRADLSNSDFSFAILNDAIISNADLSNTLCSYAQLSGSNLNGANLSHAVLRGANLRATDLRKSDLSDTDLSNAVLSESVLFYANLSNADLSFADFASTSISSTIFANNDLSLVKGLDQVKHLGPSSIGIDTLYRSAGRIPESFLRGCGLPDELITIIPSHFGLHKAINFYSCFISYSMKDEEFAKRLYSRMRDEQLRVWFAPVDLKGGEKLIDQIKSAIHIQDKVLLVLSENSMQSDWVVAEIREERKVELAEKRRKLFPIRLVDFERIRDWICHDADAGKDLAVEVREYFIPDFSHWKDHESFEASFKGLFKDLRAAKQEESHTDP